MYFFCHKLEKVEVDESPTSVLARKLGYICCIYNTASNGSLGNYSCQGKNGQIYQCYYNSLEC